MGNDGEATGHNNDPTGTVFPRFCTTLKRLCNYLKARFPEHNIKVRAQQITHWQEGRGVPNGAPFFPAYDSAGRYCLPDCFEWFQKHQLPKYQIAKAQTPEIPGIAETEVVVDINDLKEQEERDQILYNRWERAREQGEYIHKTVALATGIAAVKKIHVLVKAEDERLLPKQRRGHLDTLLRAAGIAPEIMGTVAAQFEAWDIDLARTITDRREQAMSLAATTAR